MPEINVAKPFTLTHEDGKTKTHFKKGAQDVPALVADHWYVKAHLVGARPNPAAGTPAFMKAAAEERAHLDAEHARLEAERDAVVNFSVREKMEGELAARMKDALAAQAKALTSGVDAEVAKRVEVTTAEIEARLVASFDERVKAAVEEALLAQMEADEKAAAEKAEGETSAEGEAASGKKADKAGKAK